MIDVLEYLDSKNFTYKREGNEAVIQCPNCNRQKLYISLVSGLYHCFYCEVTYPGSEYAKGHINKLQELLGDSLPISSVTQFIDHKKNQEEKNYTIKVNEYHSALLNHKQGLRYLFNRGFTQETIIRFKLGLAKCARDINGESIEHEWISIPIFENDTPKLIKYRQLPPEDPKLEKYTREAGGKSILFNGDVIEKFEELVIAEGELDAITLIQNGYENVIGITGGAGTLLPPWFDKLILKSKLFLILDPDPVGQKSAREVWATRLGVSKCWNVLLPENEDINSFFLNHKKEDFDKILKSSYQFKVDGIINLTDALYDLYLKSKSKENFEIYPLPWKNVNKLLGGGLSRKHLTVLGGLPGTGKTTLALQIMWYFAKQYKMPGLFFCLEMPETQLAIKVVQLNEDYSYDQIRPDEALVYSQHLEDIPIYFGYSSKIKPDLFYNTMKAARDRYGIEFGVFDNLQRMIRTGEEADMGKASGMFKDLVMDLNIPFILISQPRKMSADDEITYEMLKGSSAIPADADEVVLMNRKRQTSIKYGSEEKDQEKQDDSMLLDRLSSTTNIILDKTRYAPGGIAKLKFIGEKSRFEEINI